MVPAKAQDNSFGTMTQNERGDATLIIQNRTGAVMDVVLAVENKELNEEHNHIYGMYYRGTDVESQEIVLDTGDDCMSILQDTTFRGSV